MSDLYIELGHPSVLEALIASLQQLICQSETAALLAAIPIESAGEAIG